ncbi:hypothetical protein OTC26_026895 [Streptomyces tirandamycinicus]|uniref:hypothetical protein n=1 Tax=Streptomyces tirandamycinicus TaxID=2174846 RepID=UPI0022713983|nr:hypothetical protein [Streptomyces tirandamycinicus]MCY0982625.1 hypothetical protein [Streptomyces tirandamycinicus]
MRTVRVLTAGLLAAAALFTLPFPGVAAADSPSPSASTGDEGAAPTEAGTSFRTATVIRPGQRATAQASTGDYLYWQFPADAGQRATVRATVELPRSTAGRGTRTWRLDVYDGLRRRQACRYGSDTRAVPAGASSVELSCTLRTVRAWSEPWANDPLPGAYYVRLTVVTAPAEDLGEPAEAAVEVVTADSGGATAVDGRLAAPLVPVSGRDVEPDGGWASGWWSSRILWTACGAVLAALAGIWGHRLTRGGGRPAQVPPGA